MKKNFPREAFTLVELLIVLLIIGTLAGALLLTIANTQAKAEATNIVSDLRNLKAGAQIYYAETGKMHPDQGTGKSYNNIDTGYLKSLVDAPVIADRYNRTSPQKPYFVWVQNQTSGSFKKGIYIVRQVQDGFSSSAVRQKLGEFAKTLPLLNGRAEPYGARGINVSNQYDRESQVMLLVLDGASF